MTAEGTRAIAVPKPIENEGAGDVNTGNWANHAKSPNQTATTTMPIARSIRSFRVVPRSDTDKPPASLHATKLA